MGWKNRYPVKSFMSVDLYRQRLWACGSLKHRCLESKVLTHLQYRQRQEIFSAFASAPIPLLITIGFRLLLAVYNAAEIPAGPAPMMITSSILSPAFLIHISLLYNIHYFVKNFSIYSCFCSFIIREISDFLKRICFI